MEIAENHVTEAVIVKMLKAGLRRFVNNLKE